MILCWLRGHSFPKSMITLIPGRAYRKCDYCGKDDYWSAYERK